MAQVTITQLPQAGALTGDESVPIVQNGQTVQTTTGAISGAGALNYPFLTVGSTAGLTEARQISTNSGLSLTDNGAGSTLQINLVGAAMSLDSSGVGIQAKTGSNTVVGREIEVGAGLGITDGDGVAGNPVVSLGSFLQNFVSQTGTGILALQSGAVGKIAIIGTTSQTSIANGDGSGDVVVALASNPVLPGLAGTVVPTGGTGDRPVSPANGTLRYNTDLAVFEGYANGVWGSIAAGVGVTSIGTGFGLLGGPITSTGTIEVDNTVVATLSGSQTLINKTINGPDNTLTNIGNSSLSNSSVTYNGVTVALGASGTITAAAPYALTIGTGLSGTSYDGSSAVTIAIDSTVATLTGTQTLTNKTMSGASNTFTNIPNSALTNSQITLGTTNISLGATSLAPVGLTSVTVTQDPTTNLQLATKQYVDSLAASGIHYHDPVYVESPDTAGNLNATYNQPGGAGDGVGATLTNAGTQVALTIDGVLMTVGKRVLIYNQTNAVQNGVYTVTTVGSGSTNWVLTRATDADTYSPFSPDSLGQGDAFFVQAGNTGAGETYICNTVGPIVFGTTNITFAQISTAQVYSAGTGLTLTGTQFSISNTAVVAGTYGTDARSMTLAVNAQGQITSVFDQPIALAASQITSGTLAVAQGGTNLASYAAGDILYASGTTTLAKLTIGAAGYVLTSSGTAPQYVAQSTLSVGTATNAVNTGITANSTNATNYLTFVSATSGNLPQLVNSSITCNPSTGKLTGGIGGGAF